MFNGMKLEDYIVKKVDIVFTEEPTCNECPLFRRTTQSCARIGTINIHPDKSVCWDCPLQD